ncbi:hypothetical protein [Legionella sp. km772]|uniref:hypothetical protein n=1 Tax=Legionella sp. km772 TaxID=2498111 RepID=UPI000F8DDB43|nr:hypothetical protein [Legionella sp. km772]RUR08652.1 hypothetical protein ELY15_10435 [Legionella sp. km772]
MGATQSRSLVKVRPEETPKELVNMFLIELLAKGYPLANKGLARSGDLEQNSGKIRAIPGLLVHSPYSQNGLSTSP